MIATPNGDRCRVTDDDVFNPDVARPVTEQWCHKAAYHDPAIGRVPGPLFHPRTEPLIGVFWAVVVGSLSVAGLLATMIMTEVLGITSFGGKAEAAAVSVFVLLFALGPPTLAVLYLGPIRRKLRRRVLDSDGKLCVYCGHELSGRHEDNHTCPECGREIRTHDAAIYWCRHLSH